MLVSVALVLVNAFFVASEFAIVKLRPSRLAQLAARGQRRARVALGIARRLDTYLSANQLGITLASLALGWIGEPAFAELLKPLFAIFPTFTWRDHSGSLGVAGKVVSPKGAMRLIVG
jgi:CBS domain containing-hemolysin-like protein